MQLLFYDFPVNELSSLRIGTLSMFLSSTSWQERLLQVFIAVSAQHAAADRPVAVAQIETACGRVGFVHVQADALFAGSKCLGRQGIQKCGTNATLSVGGGDGDGVQIPFVGVAFGVGEEALRRVKVALLQGSGER